MKRQVLLVDDNLMIRTSLRESLSDAGFSVVEARNGLDGLTRAKNQYFDAFVIDFKMPIMDGITLIKGLRSMKNYQYTVITLLTTVLNTGFDMQVGQLRDIHVLEKPVNHQQVIDLISKPNLFRSTA